MRKKLFAIVMSMTMVASFMPSLAFAGVNPAPTKSDYLDGSHEFGIVTETTTNDEVKALPKDQVVEFTPATCTKDGSVTLKCIREANYELCTATKTFVVKAQHNFVEKRLTVEAYAKAMQAAKAAGFLNDAQVAGKIASISEEYCYVEAPVCKVCGAIDKDHAAIGTVGIHHEKSATSQGADCKTTTPCVKCGKELKKNAGVAAKHSFQKSNGDLKDDAVPTAEKKLCGDVIAKTYTCTVCGETKTTYTKGGAEATPTCKIFKKAISVVESKDHKTLYKSGTSVAVATRANADAEWVAEPGYKVSTILANTVYEADTTVVENGVTYYAFTCNECGYVTKGVQNTSVTTAAHKHAWKKVTEDATCVAAPKEAAYCEGCGMYSAVANAGTDNNVAAENMKDTFAAASSDVAGKAPLGHKLNVKKVEATCAVPGHYEISCSVCGDDYDGVDYVQFVTDSNKAPLYLNANGTVTDSGVYGATQLPYIDPAVKNHSFTKKVVLKEATCDVPELSGFKCDVCGKMNVHAVTETAGSELGHKPEKVNVKAPTCGWSGGYQLQCSVCKKYADDKDQTAWTKDVDDAYWFNEGNPVVGKNAECKYDKWVVTKASTVFEEGVKTLTCSVCGDEEFTKTVIAKKTVAKASNTVTVGKKSLTVKSSAANATGYRVYYKKAGAKSWKSYTKKTTSLSKTFSGLSKGKYYVKVRAYAKNYDGDGQVVWGATSSTKSVKVK